MKDYSEIKELLLKFSFLGIEKCGFSTKQEDWRRELAAEIYVWTDNSTATKINILHGMFEECNIPASELIFEFRQEIEEVDEG